jgi:hypothetical protein
MAGVTLGYFLATLTPILQNPLPLGNVGIDTIAIGIRHHCGTTPCEQLLAVMVVLVHPKATGVVRSGAGG